MANAFGRLLFEIQVTRRLREIGEKKPGLANRWSLGLRRGAARTWLRVEMSAR
jgi:hypothetical protein